jgi:hypothetical protein
LNAIKAVQKRHQRVLRSLLPPPIDKKGANWGEHCAVNANITQGIFVCTNCSGIHREFGERIKSVSMTRFAQDEVNALQQ